MFLLLFYVKSEQKMSFKLVL